MNTENGRVRLYATLSVIAFVTVFVTALAVGRYSLSLGDVMDFLLGNLPHDSNPYKVISELRLPRTIIAALVGIGLGLSGLLYQETFQNKLVSPDFLGVTSGACVGAAAAILLGLSAAMISLLAFIAGVVTVMLTLTLSKVFQNRSPTILLLSGIIIGGLMSALLAVIKYFADPDSTLSSITFWLMGSCEHTTMGDAAILLPIIATCAMVLVVLRWRINLVALGREEAQTKGLNYTLYRRAIILMATLMTASAVSIVGSVGWIGLVIPHMVRILVGRNTANTIPLTILFGGIFMILVDIISRSFTDAEVPLAAISGLFGTVIFIGILYIRRRTILESDRSRQSIVRLRNWKGRCPGRDIIDLREGLRQRPDRVERLREDHPDKGHGRIRGSEGRHRQALRKGPL